MTRRAKYIYLLCFIVLPATGWAQRTKIKFRDRLGDSTIVVNTAEEPERVKKPPRLRGELSAGFSLNSNGWGIYVDKGYLRGGEKYGSINRDKYFHVRLIEIAFNEIKHPKETRASSVLPGLPFQPGSYILGKTNSFYQLNLGYGRRQLIAGKPDPGTISIHWVYLGGFSAGLLKPYYLELENLGTVKYSENIESFFIAPGNIRGKAPFNKGIDEIEFVPGVYLKTGLHFDFAGKRKGLSALETGVAGFFYTRKIEQMVWQDPNQFFFNFYAAIQFGKRW